MDKLVEEIKHLCSIYSVDFRNVAEKQIFGVGKDLSEKIDFALIDTPVTVRRDQKKDHVKHDLISPSNVKNMATVP